MMPDGTLMSASYYEPPSSLKGVLCDVDWRMPEAFQPPHQRTPKYEVPILWPNLAQVDPAVREMSMELKKDSFGYNEGS
jgi:hypothetical protein